MVRHLFCIVLTLIGFASYASAQADQPAPADRQAWHNDLTNPKAVEAAGLNRSVPALKLDQTKLADAISMLRDRTGANIFVNWKSLEGEGIARDAKITVGLAQMPLRRALDVILIVVTNGERRLGYSIDDGVITITSLSDMWRDRMTRVYDIRDLITGADAQEKGRRVDALVKLLADTIDPSSWKVNSGGAVRELQGQLIVTQTSANHRQILQLIAHLRAAFATNTKQQFPKLELKPAKTGEN